MTHTNTFNIFMSYSIRSEDNSLETLRAEHQIFTSIYIFKSSLVSVRKEAALSCGLKKIKEMEFGFLPAILQNKNPLLLNCLTLLFLIN